MKSEYIAEAFFLDSGELLGYIRYLGDKGALKLTNLGAQLEHGSAANQNLKEIPCDRAFMFLSNVTFDNQAIIGIAVRRHDGFVDQRKRNQIVEQKLSASASNSSSSGAVGRRVVVTAQS